MSVIRIEPDGSADGGACSCCGNVTRTVWGYVHRDENVRAVYYCRWAQGHIEDGMLTALSVGGWGEGADEAERRLVGLECRLVENGPSFRVRDAADTPWGDVDDLGLKLTREEMLAGPLRQETFDIIDRIVEDDARVRDFLAGANTPYTRPNTALHHAGKLRGFFTSRFRR